MAWDQQNAPIASLARAFATPTKALRARRVPLLPHSGTLRSIRAVPPLCTMEFVERLSGLSAGRASQPAAKLLSFTDLSPHVQRHLAQVRRAWWRRRRRRRTRRLPGAVVGAVPNLRLLPAWIVLVGVLSGSYQFAWTQDLHVVFNACLRLASHVTVALCLPLQVYTTLTVALLLSAAGVWVSAATRIGQGVGMLGFMVSLFALRRTC